MERKLLPIIDFAHGSDVPIRISIGSDVPGKQSPDGKHKEYLWSRK